MAGLLERRRTERRQRRADRRTRRADRLEARAANNRTRAAMVQPTPEVATIQAPGGQPEQVILTKSDSSMRNARLDALEAENEELRAEMAELRAQLAEIDDELATRDDDEGRQEMAMRLLSEPVLAILDGAVGVINAGDDVISPTALRISEGLDSYLDFSREQDMSDSQRNLVRIIQLAAKMWAYYDPETGLASLVETDPGNS